MRDNELDFVVHLKKKLFFFRSVFLELNAAAHASYIIFMSLLIPILRLFSYHGFFFVGLHKITNKTNQRKKKMKAKQNA